MIKSARSYIVAELLNNDGEDFYKVPRYQREYAWRKSEWEFLFDDLLENDKGYFLGSIICLNNSQDSLQAAEMELIDGQQRMATISLLMLSLYSHLKKNFETASKKKQAEITNLESRLVASDKGYPRLVLQQQNFNNEDYLFLLDEEDLLQGQAKPKNLGNRLLTKAFRYFCDRLDMLDDEEKWSFLGKLYGAVMVKIEVDSHADAFILFESLNNRGKPLSAVDIIKNKILGALEYKGIGNIEANFNKWNQIIKNLGDDYIVQDRFFRQYLNAFKSTFPEEIKFSIATKSNMIQLYEKLIDHDPGQALADMLQASGLYSEFIAPEDQAKDNSLKKPLLNLSRVRGVAAYILLLYLFKYRESLKLNDEQLKKIIDFLVSFFVRRNVTDVPPTRDVSRIFMDIIDAVSSRQGEAIYKIIKKNLKARSASDKDFEAKLKDDIYSENADSTRFLLAMLAEEGMTKETRVDLWERLNGKDYIWTIEHVLPQADNLGDCWVKMLANGDMEKAKEIQEEYLHKLGNLTLSGFNSSLSKKCFKEKRDMKKDGKYIGYKNGLKLNEDLAAAEEWNAEQIEARTERLAGRVLQLFPLV